MTDYNKTYELAPTVNDVIVAAKASAWDLGWVSGRDHEQAILRAAERGELAGDPPQNPYERLMQENLIAEAKRYVGGDTYAANLINRLAYSLEAGGDQ